VPASSSEILLVKKVATVFNFPVLPSNWALLSPLIYRNHFIALLAGKSLRKLKYTINKRFVPAADHPLFMGSAETQAKPN